MWFLKKGGRISSWNNTAAWRLRSSRARGFFESSSFCRYSACAAGCGNCHHKVAFHFLVSRPFDIATLFLIHFSVGYMKQQKAYQEGIVEESLPNTLFKVRLDDGREVLAHLSGRMRMNHIRVLPGDRVRLETTPYDDKKGRIVHRLK